LSSFSELPAVALTYHVLAEEGEPEQLLFLKTAENTEDTELRNQGYNYFRVFRVFRGYGFLIRLFRSRPCWRGL